MKNFTIVLLSRDAKVLINIAHRSLALLIIVELWNAKEREGSMDIPRSGTIGGVGKKESERR